MSRDNRHSPCIARHPRPASRVPPAAGPKRLRPPAIASSVCRLHLSGTRSPSVTNMQPIVALTHGKGASKVASPVGWCAWLVNRPNLIEVSMTSTRSDRRKTAREDDEERRGRRIEPRALCPASSVGAGLQRTALRTPRRRFALRRTAGRIGPPQGWAGHRPSVHSRRYAGYDHVVGRRPLRSPV